LKLYEIYQRLYDNHFEEAVLPVAILTGKFDDKSYMKNDTIIYPMLPDEFKMGVPLGDDSIKLKKKYMKPNRPTWFHVSS
jgi:hypothetical protein